MFLGYQLAPYRIRGNVIGVGPTLSGVPNPAANPVVLHGERPILAEQHIGPDFEWIRLCQKRNLRLQECNRC